MLNVFGPLDTSDLILMVAFTFAMQRQLIGLASGPFMSFNLAKFGWVAFADLRVQRLKNRTQNSQRVCKNSCPIFTRL